MRLYVALVTVSICVVFVITQENNYGEYRALVLVGYMSLFGKTKFHRPTSVMKRTNADDDESPYDYEVARNIISSMMSQVYFFCPPDGKTKVLFKNKNSNACEFSIRTEFTDGRLRNFGNTVGRLIFNGYSYTNQKIEECEQLRSDTGAKISTNCETSSDSVYGFVYDCVKKRSYYVQYTIYSRDLLDSDAILAEEKDFITEPTRLVEEHDFKYVEESLDDMEKEVKDFPLEGRDQISNATHDYYRATLASRFHFPFVQYKRPLFHYSNITLVHKDILKLFVETQIFISEIKMDKLRIIAVPYFHFEEKDTRKQDTQDTGFGDQDIISENIKKKGNEKSRHKYAPDIIGYLIFDKKQKYGIAIILHNESESKKNNIISQCAEDEYKMNCESYHEHLKNKKVGEKIRPYAYCCKVGHILWNWRLLQPFPESFITSEKHFKDLYI